MEAARELAKAGEEVTFLERSDRVGGRVFTLRHHSHYAEAGAIAIADSDQLSHQVADELSLKRIENTDLVKKRFRNTQTNEWIDAIEIRAAIKFYFEEYFVSFDKKLTNDEDWLSSDNRIWLEEFAYLYFRYRK